MSTFRVKFSAVAVALALGTLPVLASAQVVNNVQAKYAGSQAGNWSQTGGGSAVTGAPDNSCANMGTAQGDRQNWVYNFGFTIPLDATITGVTSQVKATTNQQSGQTVGVQLVVDATAATATGIGLARSFVVPNNGSCSGGNSVWVAVNGTLVNWGLDSTTMTPAIANSTGFGVDLSKQEQSSVAVDTICLEVNYTTAAGPAVQESLVRPAGRTHLEVQVLYSPGKGKS
jgi:hypothetical protein